MYSLLARQMQSMLASSCEHISPRLCTLLCWKAGWKRAAVHPMCAEPLQTGHSRCPYHAYYSNDCIFLRVTCGQCSSDGTRRYFGLHLAYR